MKLKIEVWSCTFFSNRWDEKKATCLIIHSWSSIEIKVLYLILIYRKIYKIFCLFNLNGRSTFITTNATLMICNLCIYFCWPIVFFISIQFSMCAYLLSVPLYHMADPPTPQEFSWELYVIQKASHYRGWHFWFFDSTDTRDVGSVSHPRDMG